MSITVDRLKDTEVLTERAYRSLRDAISSLDVYDPNVNLRLDERTLAQQLGVSRTPIRESLVRLENEGFVKMIPHKGRIRCAQVSGPDYRHGSCLGSA